MTGTESLLVVHIGTYEWKTHKAVTNIGNTTIAIVIYSCWMIYQ